MKRRGFIETTEERWVGGMSLLFLCFLFLFLFLHTVP